LASFARIEGGLTPMRARQIAIMLDTGAMPATLAPVEAESP
jgi:preprotein translocase subunit SecD